MNAIHISGNIGAEPEFKSFGSGKRKVCFSVALNQYGTNGQRCDTIWIPCQAWDAAYDRILKLQQKSKLSGRRINITGSLSQTKWTDPATGKHLTKLIVKVLAFELIAGVQQEDLTTRRIEPPAESEIAAEAIFDGKAVELGIRRRLPFPFKSGELRAAKEDS
jgi:single-stranded DNA-binding protein